MAKIVNIKKYQKRKGAKKILLCCVDNDFKTRYITAEFNEESLLIKFTHFCHYMQDGNINSVLKFSPKQQKAFESNLTIKSFKIKYGGTW